MEFALVLLVLLLILLGGLYLKKQHELANPSRASLRQRRVYERGGGSAISVTSLNTETDSSAATIRHIPTSSTTSVASVATTVTAVQSPATENLRTMKATETTSVITSDRSDNSSQNSSATDLRNNLVCDCGNADLTIPERENLKMPEKKDIYKVSNPVYILPINFSKHQPVALNQTIAEPTEICKQALTAPETVPTNYLTAFHPVIHTIYFAHHHASLIQELIENYNYL
ncbi:unnamed protein product [Bursaphelenchus okinawaensis]|uniref:Uncharacterized protein n=1 Tax=Bursaphelenchus okinawaensis TaxID=465554 RepID=A0A811LN03_9BILA|nr:unnamed protein product [Bursaphelenchus okinawaensis]CAG9124307.1 unnamed protein product [Bursaphelenchus okinawaensis]